jgi:hypothetical protein
MGARRWAAIAIRLMFDEPSCKCLLVAELTAQPGRALYHVHPPEARIWPMAQLPETGTRCAHLTCLVYCHVWLLCVSKRGELG